MKKLVLFAGVLVAVSFASCNGAKEQAAQTVENAAETVEAGAASTVAGVDSPDEATVDSVKAAL